MDCRICRSPELVDVIDLGEQHITSRFPEKGDFSTPKTPVVLCLCVGCGLLQLRDSTAQSELYEHEYGYRSGISDTMRSHLRAYHEELTGKVSLQAGDVVLDIGSNDATFLRFYGSGVVRVGIDPTGTQFASYYTDEVLIADYFSADAFRNRFPTQKCRIVSSIAMFYDLPDPVRFASDIETILEDDGVWTCEQSYLLSMLDTNSIDTICHEHIEYYALSQVKEIADRARLKIIDVRFNASNGGSFRVYLAKRSSAAHAECTDLLTEILQKEEKYALKDPETYRGFYRRCGDQARRLRLLVRAINGSGQNVWVYGASTKGNCTLQFAGLTLEDTPFAVERNPKKFGRMTPTGVEIISEEVMRRNPPQFLLVLPWHFREEIVRRERAFLEGGGSLIFPFPTLDIVGPPRLLLTGCDGHIASYFLDHYRHDYKVFGVAKRERGGASGIPRFVPHTDAELADCVLSTRPQYVLHLAGISNSQTALEDPVATLDVNGRMVVVLADCILRNKLPTRLVNVSSSEIFKGHGQYVVRAGDHYYRHLHPYSIAKVLGHSFVEFYRGQHGCPFYNAILFMTESERKSTDFLFNKLASHSHRWVDDHAPLAIGGIGSARNIIHASDVAHALHRILTSGRTDYVLCHDESHWLEELVVGLYRRAGVSLVPSPHGYSDEATGALVLAIDPQHKRNEQVNNIQGDNSLLRQLGWEPKMTVDDILDEISNHHRRLKDAAAVQKKNEG